MISLAVLVAQANIQRLALIGLAKNVGKTTTTNHLLSALLSEGFYVAEELAITSLGLDGEASDALTGLPKPRYAPEAGLLVATTEDLLRQAENDGTRMERLLHLPGRTALGPVILARILQPGRVILAGPTLLRDLHFTLEQCQHYGTRLGIVDGAINRLGAAAPAITDACIVCTGASVGAMPELVARRTTDVLCRLTTPLTQLIDVYRNLHLEARLLSLVPAESGQYEEQSVSRYTGSMEPGEEAQWIIEGMKTMHKMAFLLRGAFTEELARELLAQLFSTQVAYEAELIISDGTKIFCHSIVLQRLAARGLHIRVAEAIRILAITSNPYTPEYDCTSQRLLDALSQELPTGHPPVLDVVSGLSIT